MNADFRTMPRWPGLLGSLGRFAVVQPVRVLAIAVLTLLGAMAQPAGAEQVDYGKFEHMTTGFKLDGQHLNLKCEQCHLNGIFEGTPRQCGMCHIQGNPRSAVFMPTNHIPTPLQCDSCHTTNTFQGTHFAHSNVMPGTCAQCHNNVNAKGKTPTHIATTASCDACHSTVSFAAAFSVFPTGHIPTTQACATCHSAGYSMTLTKMVHAGISGSCTACHAADAPGTAPLTFRMTFGTSNGAPVILTPTSQNYHPPTSSSPTHFMISESCNVCHTTPAAPMAPTAAAGGFAGGVMNHAGITSGCANCHADGVGPFVGVTGLVTETTKGTHIPISGTACENCHKSTTVPGGFAGTAMVHTGLNGLSTCSSCHENTAANVAYYGLTGKMVVRPPTSGAQPDAVTPIDPNHPTTGECSQCHSSTTSFNSNIAKPSNHIPTGTTACTNCHLGSSAPYAPANTSMNHTGFTTTCAGCHGAGLSFYGTAQTEAGGQPMQPPGSVGTSGAANHIPYAGADCVSCHAATSNAQGGFKITGTTPILSATGHAAVKSLSCQSCHAAGMAWLGVTSLVTPATNHIPIASAGCASCHASNFATGGFHITTSPVLSVAGHAAVAGVTCATCHESSSINPATINWQGVGTSIYLRPGATKGPDLSPADAAHATGTLLTGDCGQCHSTTPPFTNLTTLPSNHIPLPTTSTPACSVCHSAGYGVGKTIMVHTSVTGESCTTCHGSGKGPFSGTSQGTGGQPMQPPGAVGTSGAGNHIPVASADCGACHAATDAMTGTGFKTNTTPALSAAGHTAVVSSLTCESCHSSGMAWYGVTIKTPPGTVGTSGAGNHIPIPGADTCKTCHASTNYVSFAGTTMNHSGISSNCSQCHNAGMAWYGVTIKTNTLTPPHIPVATAPVCEGCHSATNFTAFGPGTAMNPTTHLQVPTSLETCATCHETGLATSFYGVTIVTRPTAAQDAAHPTTGDCGGCHTTTPPFTGNVKPSNHIPSSATCTNCHTGYTPATTTMVHTDSVVAATSCNTCHNYGAGPYYGTAQGQAGGQPLQPGGTLNGAHSSTQHMPFNAVACNVCHSSTTVPGGFATGTVPHTSGGGFMTYTQGNRSSGSGSSTPKCVTCHAPSGTTWQNASGFGTATMGSHQGSSASADCIDCHNATGGFGGAAAAKAVPRRTNGLTTRPGGPGTRPGLLPRVAGAGPYSHMGVAPGSCTSCHSAVGGATQMPGGHMSTTLSCDACHRTTAWAPATYAHAGVGPGHCANCHMVAGYAATPKPSWHFVTARSCDVCHHSTSTWLPVVYDHLSPRYRPQTGIVRCIDCHTTNTEMVVPAVRAGARRPVPGGAARP